MENLYSRILSLLPSKNEIKRAISHFSKREYFIFLSFVFILCLSTIIILQNINKSFMVEVALQGGSITEGIVGTPRFINPVLAFSDADQDLVSLIYSGLMRKNSDGTLTPDLAEKYEVSKDGLTYTFTLKNEIYFHDEKPVGADDVVFTINKIKDPVIKSPKRGNWDGVSVEKIDEKTVKFTLKQSYASFLENTTLGIMPASLWEASPRSGPYKVAKVNKQSGGLIDYYELAFFEKFNLGEPYIEKIILRFYPNENDQISALESGEVDQISSITPSNAQILKEKNYRVESLTLPRVFGLFLNQNQNQIFTDKNIITAIDLAINKDDIIRNYQKLNKGNNISHEEKIKKAQDILSKDGWKNGADGFLEKTTTDKKKKKTTAYLEFSISTGNAPELVKSAELIKKDLENIGMKVDIKTFEAGNLTQSVIRPRKYDVLLFGQVINHESDLYAFWHSSQRKDPGLNVAMYTNAKVDKILEDASITIDEKSRIKKYAQFEDEIKKDMPAVFLYSPNFIYIVSKNIQRFSIDHIIRPEDRFLNSYLWYIKTDNVWKIFSE
ncbi:MAG: Extracellular solute-binding protein family 5 [Parcubacteria group bacterium GW2011_GWC1_35_21]|nr:MAG: Extracellular solute-binding protein family 5 [Parcubacteria group bacterium GW2011_GWC1_35_21]